MPCQSDYLAASGQELESRRVCNFLVYIHERLQRSVPTWISDAADDYYGNVSRLDEATKMLCEQLRSLTQDELEDIVYDTHNGDARRLADWWERHQEWDKRRVAEEKASRKFKEQLIWDLLVWGEGVYPIGLNKGSGNVQLGFLEQSSIKSVRNSP